MAAPAPGNLLNERWLTVADRFFKEGFAALSPMEQRFFAVFNLVGELAIGGFAHYFSGSTGHLGEEAARALDTIGAVKAASIVREAMSPFPGGLPDPDWDLRHESIQTILEHGETPWEGLSDAFQSEVAFVLERLEDDVERNS